MSLFSRAGVYSILGGFMTHLVSEYFSVSGIVCRGKGGEADCAAGFASRGGSSGGVAEVLPTNGV